jgi:glycosyltransferase involved in cell wall biosynthesis
MADVSVLIPTRDRLWSLPRAVESCRSSTLKVQIIVIDDASTDGTREWLERQRDLEVVRGEGWGKPWGVNRAMGLANGTYVRFLDSDDWLNNGANEVQYEAGENSDADIIVSGMDIYRDDKFVETIPWIPTDDFVAQQLGETLGSHYSAFLFRREFVSDIPHRTLFPASNFASRDDRCFVLEAALRHPRLAVSPIAALCHRQHERQRLQFRGGIRAIGSNIQTLNVFQQILKLLEDRSELTARRRRAATRVLWPLAHWIARTDLEEGSRIARWVFELEPEFKPPDKGSLGLLYRNLGFVGTARLLKLRRMLLAPLASVVGRRYR